MVTPPSCGTTSMRTSSGLLRRAVLTATTSTSPPEAGLASMRPLTPLISTVRPAANCPCQRNSPCSSATNPEGFRRRNPEALARGPEAAAEARDAGASCDASASAAIAARVERVTERFMLPPKVLVSGVRLKPLGFRRPALPCGVCRSPRLTLPVPPSGGRFFQPVSDLKTPCARGLWQLFSEASVLDERAGEESLAGERGAEAVEREREDGDQPEGRAAGVPDAEVRGHREEVEDEREELHEDAGQQPEAQQHEENQAGAQRAEHPVNRRVLSGERAEHGYQEEGRADRRPPAAEDDREDEQKEQKPRREEQRVDGLPDEDRDDVLHPRERGRRRDARRVRRHTKPLRREYLKQLDDLGDETEERADEYVAPDERVAVVAREQAVPGDDDARPAPPHQRLDGDVDQPQHRGEEDREGQELDEEFKLSGDLRHVVRRRQPGDHLRDEDEAREAERALAVAAPHPQVVAREQRRAQKDHEEDDDGRRLRDACGGAFRRLLFARGTVPGVDDLEADELAAEGRGLNSDWVVGPCGLRAFPGRALVEGLLRSPTRLGRLEGGLFESGFGEDARPVEGLRGGTFGSLRRSSVEADHVARAVEQNARHPGDGARRVELRDALPAQGHEVARALPVPEAERHGTARLQPVPTVRRLVVFPDVLQVFALDEEAVGRVGRRVVAEPARHLRAALLQTLHGLLQRHAPVQKRLVREPEREHERGERRGQQRDGDHGTETSLLRRGGDHLRRGRLAGGKRGGQRVSAGQCRRDFERRGRAVFRV